MSYLHRMPFGAEVLDDRQVRFRLWAPGASSVAVDLSSKLLPMNRLDGGWFELATGEAAAGCKYQFAVEEGRGVPDPASRFQPSGVHGPSEVVDPRIFRWQESNWRGRPWEETVLYELHVGTFTPEGTYAGAEQKVDYLIELGITAIELMPLSSFPGTRNWGYDGVFPYAPTAHYGRPEDLKRFIDTAHSKNLMVFLDVVYNHFGPEGNYLNLYAPQFFTERHHTPWGQAINFDGPDSHLVRDYFIHNALYWLEEYRFDGLRLDAVHAIYDDSNPDFLTVLGETVRKTIGQDRHVHLVLENDNNAAHYLHRNSANKARLYTGQWNDDFHHAEHVLITGEADGYYEDYSDDPVKHLGRCLTEGFAYQGDVSPYRHGRKRGEPSRELRLSCFVSFLQNHDQVGNRAFGERISNLADTKKLKVALAVWLLAPSPPLLFMGEEFDASTPFLFFCDFEPELATAVREGRRAEFARFAQFNSAEARASIPDPNDKETFWRSKLDWTSVRNPAHAHWLRLYTDLLDCRRVNIVPHMNDVQPGKASYKKLAERAISVVWPLEANGRLALLANFGDVLLPVTELPAGSLIYTTAADCTALRENKSLPPYSVAWFLKYEHADVV
jgi:maltooligosyltrehalose trehalohydrolase